MTDPGLDQRLRQRSRRAGLMIGVSMALTIALCVAGFSVIYAALDDTIGDFVSRDVPTAVVRSTEAPESATEVAEVPEPTEEAAGDVIEPPATNAPEPTSEATEAADDGAFTPDYQSSVRSKPQFSIRAFDRGRRRNGHSDAPGRHRTRINRAKHRLRTILRWTARKDGSSSNWKMEPRAGCARLTSSRLNRDQ
jgi:hypothetical protein